MLHPVIAGNMSPQHHAGMLISRIKLDERNPPMCNGGCL